MVSVHFLNIKVEKNVLSAILQREILVKFPPIMWIFQIPDIQSCLFVIKMMQLNKYSLFWNIYDVF